MPKLKKLSWERHKTNWKNCQQCPLCNSRTQVVLARGSLPADVAIIGEAPGQGEDVLGKPFIGNAGKLLDELIEAAEEMADYVPRKIFSNLVACIPLDESGYKTDEPPTDSIKTCGPRLQELIEIAKPRAIIMVGKSSQKWSPKVLDYGFKYSTDIIHPAALLRADISQRGLAIQRTVVEIRDLFKELKNGKR